MSAGLIAAARFTCTRKVVIQRSMTAAWRQAFRIDCTIPAGTFARSG
jgi:hypothetical protein